MLLISTSALFLSALIAVLSTLLISATIFLACTIIFSLAITRVRISMSVHTY